MDELRVLEKFFRTQLGTVSELATCVGTKIYNSFALPKTPFPYDIFTLIPLNDRTGQARTSIQSRFLVDNKILSTFPVDANVSAALAAVKEHFRNSLTFDADGFRISVRHERPIFYVEKGAIADQRILHQGSTFAVWMSKT